MSKMKANQPSFVEGFGGIALPQKDAVEQMQHIQMAAIRIQASIEIMAKITSVMYAEAMNNARMAKFNEIKSKIKSESPEYVTEEELSQKTLEEFNKSGQRVDLQLNLGMCADMSVQAAEMLIRRLTQ